MDSSSDLSFRNVTFKPKVHIKPYEIGAAPTDVSHFSSKNPLFKKSALKNADEEPNSKSKKKLFQRRGTGYPGADGFSEKNRRKFSVIGNLKNFSSESEQSEDEFAQSHPKNFNSTPIFQEKNQKKQKQKVFFDDTIEEVPQCRISKDSIQSIDSTISITEQVPNGYVPVGEIDELSHQRSQKAPPTLAVDDRILQKYARRIARTALKKGMKEVAKNPTKAPEKNIHKKFSKSVDQINAVGEDDKFKRKASLFPTAIELPSQRGKDFYGRKQSVAEFTKTVYNTPKSQKLSNADVPISQRRLSRAVKAILKSEENGESGFAFLKYTVDVWPHSNFYNVLEYANLTAVVTFENGIRSELLEFPRSGKYWTTAVFNGADHGEPEKIQVWLKSTNKTSKTWMLDCCTLSTENSNWIFPSCQWFGNDCNNQELPVGVRYQVCIRTGNSIGAGTNSEVLIQIFGDHGEKTNYWKLGYSETNKTPFKRGQADVFTIGDRDIGYPTKIKLRVVKQERFFSKWQLDSVTVSVCRFKEKNYPDWDNSLKFSANNSWFEAGQAIEMESDELKRQKRRLKW